MTEISRTYVIANTPVEVIVKSESRSVADAITKGIEVMMRGVENGK